MPDAFQHIRIILGFIISLSLARLLAGIARFIQHPGKIKPDPLHLLWAASILVLLVHFWWWEFWLGVIPVWTFSLYAFLLAFGLQLYMLAALLFPDDISEYAGYGDYFLHRRAWFFGIYASVQLFDIADTLIKGENHASRYDWTYWTQDAVTFVIAVAAIFIPNRKAQLGVAALALAGEAWSVLENFTLA